MERKWIGKYIYGEGYSEHIIGKSAGFSIICSIEDGIINGTCIDEDTQAIFDKPATVHGFIDEEVISFIKVYPSSWRIDKTGNKIIQENTQVPEIHYSGIKLSETLFGGSWKMTIAYVSENGEIFSSYFNGTWKMQVA